MKKEIKRRVTLKDIAKVVDMSVSQISRALHNKGEVAPETREKIQKLADELGYTPNIVAQSLRARKTKSIGIIQDDIANPFFSVLVRGIEDAAQKMGFSILVSNTHAKFETEEKLIVNMLDRGVDGLLIVPVRVKRLNRKLFEKYNVPVVLIARAIRDGPIHCAVVDDFLGGYEATEHLIKRGHRRIVYFGGPEDMIASIDRMQGYKKALEEHGIPFLEDMVHIVGTTMDEGYSFMKKLLEHKRDFTAVFTFNDVIAYGCLHAFREKELNVPRDIAIVGYDDSDLNIVLNPQLTSVHQPTYEMGRKSAELIIELIESQEVVKPQTVLFKPELKVREST